MQIIVPARNEERRLPQTLTALRNRLVEDRAAGLSTGDIEVIVVDNASTDATRHVAESASSPDLPVWVTTCAQPGKGAAVRHGMLRSTHDVVAFMDADGATDLSALRVAMSAVESGADIAVGSRAVTGSQTWARHSRLRAHGATAFRRLSRNLVPGINDTQCGFKVLRGDLARQLFAEVRTDGFSFDVELLARALSRGALVVEFPVVWHDVPGSTFVPARHGGAAFWELFMISWYVRTLRPEPRTAARGLPLPIPLAVPAPMGLAATAVPALDVPSEPLLPWMPQLGTKL
jgi:glycosyltransferase involved in cell wall biosynthesis